MEAAGTFTAVVALAELREGFLTTHVVEDREIVLATTADGVRAYDATCPHSDFQLVPGRLPRGCLIECPMHGARFDAADGSVVKGPAKEPLDPIESRVSDGVVEVLVDWL
jgi:nitrite reductase/ring-hydroxylating ferredoxin subunit